MDSIFKSWQESLTALHASIGKELAEIRSCKAEVERMKDSIIDNAARGRFIHDDNRIILSAPEIVIGNVGKDGVLRDGGSTIIVRGNNVSLEGVDNGVVRTRASRIEQIAEDPGIDGNEHVVQGTSQIVSMGRNVVLHASDAEGTFFETPQTLGSGVQIHSDSNLTIDATVPNEKRGKSIDNTSKSLKASKDAQKKRMDELEISTKRLMKDIENVFEDSEKLKGDSSTLRANAMDLKALHEKFKSLIRSLAETSTEYITQMSKLAETERQIADLEKAKKKNDDATADYKTDATGPSLTLASENIALKTIDGDGNIREDMMSGIALESKNVTVTAMQKDGQLQEDSSFIVKTQNVFVDTSSAKLDEKGENGDITTKGSFGVLAKDISMTAIDSEVSNKEIKEKALVKDSSITFRTEKIKAETTDTEGKATGSIEMNTKALELKAVDLDKEKRTDKEMAAGSTITVFAEKMSLGSRDKEKNKAKQIQLTGEKVAVLGKETTEMQQGDGKAIVQLDGGNLKISGSETEIYGKTTIQAATEIKAELKVPKATVDNLEAPTSFKSANISDGVAVPAAPSSASLSAKLQEEEMKAEDNG